MSPPKIGGPSVARAQAKAQVEQLATQLLKPMLGEANAKLYGHAVADTFEAATRPGQGLGTQGLNDPNIAAARKAAAASANTAVDWKHPEKTLDKMSQIDSDSDVNAGGNDAVRCGAATLVAGAVLLGPEKFQKGLNKVVDRAEKVAKAYDKLADGFERHNMPDQAAQARTDAQAVRDAEQTIQSRVDSDPKSLNLADLSQIQDNVYKVAQYDQQLTTDGMVNMDPVAQSPYLSTGAMVTYRDLMWGGSTPKMGGEKVQIDHIDNQAGGGHFVLAGKDGKVAYNPWPDSDGTAFSRGVDGDGARVVKDKAGPGELVGKNINDFKDARHRALQLGNR